MTKISDASLVSSVNDDIKIPTGEDGDLAISVGQIKESTIEETDLLYDPAGSASTAETNANNYTNAQIAAIHNPFLGVYTSLANLQAAHPTALVGDYADVDPGSGTDAERYLWDTDEGWVSAGSGSGTVNSGAQYRLPYYSTNPTGTTLDAAAAITASRILKSDANGVPTHTDFTTEEFDHAMAMASLYHLNSY